MNPNRKPQRKYEVWHCPLCGRDYKENSWWRHGIGRCTRRLTQLGADAEQQQAMGEQETPRRSN